MTEVALCPAQRAGYDELLSLLPAGNFFVLFGSTGCGRTTVLDALNRKLGGAFVSTQHLMEILSERRPLQIEESFLQMVLQALSRHDTVFVDDLHLMEGVVGDCRHFYPRQGLLAATLTAIVSRASGSGKKLIFGSSGRAPGPVSQRCFYASIPRFKVEDYEFLTKLHLEKSSEPHSLLSRVASKGGSAPLDFEKIHRFAPKLNAHQLKNVCSWMKMRSAVSTDSFLDYLRTQQLGSNVDLAEVQTAELSSLKGMDDLLESLEANIIVPLERDDLAAEFKIKPKRGVLLAGPPGTGKTTVGRALAHRLKGKFFLVDGTIISGTHGFYGRIRQIFEEAKQNSPSIIFIDDTDVLFEGGEELGLYRFLLTMLDGLESESSGRVCVMMTAMNVGKLPPALIRSGRVELWLQTRLPDQEARIVILGEQLDCLGVDVGPVELPRVAEAADGLTGADLKRLVEDALILMAYDRARSRELSPPTDYFLSALAVVRSNRERYAEAEREASQQRAARPSFFDPLTMPDFD